ncbi:hypothetical protein SASPL_128500 [Salvia splendens]|uniref:Myb/SANT-like domain-containing protein n=1 Tax=Salvia splendens TaxID=180675 RepID=A0A8X8XBE5_SALSN|nr:hypothetical protein SASPL_128500 [Salvia splendens]
MRNLLGLMLMRMLKSLNTKKKVELPVLSQMKTQEALIGPPIGELAIEIAVEKYVRRLNVGVGDGGGELERDGGVAELIFCVAEELHDVWVADVEQDLELHQWSCWYAGGMSGSKSSFMVHDSVTASEGLQHTPRQKFHKGDRTRRMWLQREEKVLATSLLGLVATRWKSDNRFRSGYLSKIEDSLRQEFPTTDLKGTPHIQSKISAWKKSYGLLRSILSRIGIGFNADGDHKIDCTDEQWEQIVVADKAAKFMRTKSCPYWETWKCIFGKDRASGLGAEALHKAAERTRAQMAGGSQVNENDYHPSLYDIFFDTSPTTEQTAEVNDTASRQSDKRKRDMSDAPLMEYLGNLHAETNARLEMISKRIGYEFDRGKAREDVFDKLCTVDSLNLAQKYELYNILGDKPQCLEVFNGMPPTSRLGYLLKLIEDK